LTQSVLNLSSSPTMRFLLLLVLLALVGLPACHKPGDAAAATLDRDAAAPLHVQTAPVVEQPMPEYLTLTGSLRASQESEIAADSAGKVLQTFAERGQPVKRGQVIATLDARAASLTASAAAAQAKLAQTQLEEGRRECDRVKHLLDTGAISQADYDRQTSQCTGQQWAAAAAEAQQASATTLLGDTRIRAPFDGVIGERFVNVGQYVQMNTRVASVYAPDPLRLQLTVPEAQLGAVKQDVNVSFTVAAYGDAQFNGTVKYISPNVREASRDLVVEAMVPNADSRLKPGMFALAKLRLADRVLPVAPTAAVVRDDVGSRVFVVVGQQIQERIVQLGETQGAVTAVVQGVKAGENVVVNPGPEVRDGARVE
jgi:membrane fusion protein (multidrug efflux system)